MATEVWPAEKEETLDAQTMLSAIETYVLRERERRGIRNVDTSLKTELSGQAFGEFVMLLERQLMTTSVMEVGRSSTTSKFCRVYIDW